MTAPHKATSEQWEQMEKWRGIDDTFASFTLELRDRIAALLVARAAQIITDDPADVHLWRDDARALLLLIAEEVERRGDRGLDLDPGETSDWLRREAQSKFSTQTP